MSMAKAVAKGFGAICLAPVDRVDSAMPGSRAAYISRWPTQSRLGPLKSAIAAALGIGKAIYWPSDRNLAKRTRSEEHTSELQSLMRISYAVFCLKKKKNK